MLATAYPSRAHGFTLGFICWYLCYSSWWKLLSKRVVCTKFVFYPFYYVFSCCATHNWVSMEQDIIAVIVGVLLVEQEMLTVPKHMSSPQICSGVCVARYLVFCVDNCLLFRPFSFGLCIVCLVYSWPLITHLMSSSFSFFPTVLWRLLFTSIFRTSRE